MNIKLLLLIGSIFSFISLIYAFGYYMESRAAMETLINKHDYGDKIIVDKLRDIKDCKPNELKIFLSEIRYRGKLISILQQSMIKNYSSVKLFAEVEAVLSLIFVTIFSILMIRDDRNKKKVIKIDR